MEGSGKGIHLAHAIFHGSQALNVDAKHRIVVPREVRDRIVADRDGKAFYLVTGKNRKIWLYTERRYLAKAEERKSELVPTDDALRFDHLFFAKAEMSEPDGQNRLLIPERLLLKAHLQKEVMLIGANDHLELWNRAEWIAYDAELDEKTPEIYNQAQTRPKQSRDVTAET